MNTVAVVLEEPERLVLSRLDLTDPGEDDVVVDIEWSGISTGTERLLWSGTMPPFPGMGYPLVPGYEFGRPRDLGWSGIRRTDRRSRVRAGRALLRLRARAVRRRRIAFGGSRQQDRSDRRGPWRARRAARAGRHRLSRHRRRAAWPYRRPWRARSLARAAYHRSWRGASRGVGAERRPRRWRRRLCRRRA